MQLPTPPTHPPTKHNSSTGIFSDVGRGGKHLAGREPGQSRHSGETQNAPDATSTTGSGQAVQP